MLAADKQRRLCLVAEHAGCSTYAAAAGSSDGPSNKRWAPRATSRPIVTTTPLILDHRRIDIVMPRVLTERRAGQGGLIALLAVAFAGLIIARLSAAGPDGTPSSGQVTGPPSPSATALATLTIAPSPAAPSASPSGAPARTLVPSDLEPSPVPSGPLPARSARPTKYTVKAGDTLSAIADRLGTTWQVLAELNGIGDPGRLRVGQSLDIP